MTDSYNPKIDERIKAIRIIDAEADEIKNLINHLSELDQDSRAKVLATVHAYYGLDDAPLRVSVDWDRILRESIERNRRELEKLYEEGLVDRGPLPGAIPRYRDTEEYNLRELVKGFSEEMIQKMLDKKFNEGYTGWDEDSVRNVDNLWHDLMEHIEKGTDPDNLVDIANFCAFIWNIVRKPV